MAKSSSGLAGREAQRQSPRIGRAMSLAYRYLFPALWLSWAAYWWLASRGAKASVRQEPLRSRLHHVVPLMLAFWLLWADRVPGALLSERAFRWAPWEFWLGAAMTVAGLGFAVWARIHIGRNWSGIVTIKQDHELITDGPYALVRHPIYTGLLLAFIGSALARGEWRGGLAFLVAWAALWGKLRLEERWMVERFGSDYVNYQKRVPALLPFWRRPSTQPRNAG